MDLVKYGIYWVKFDPTVGHEIQKTRPAVVVSPDVMNARLGTVLVCPLTSAITKYPTRVYVELNGRGGEIAVDQLRAVDKSRLGRLMAVLTDAESDKLSSKLIEIFKK